MRPDPRNIFSGAAWQLISLAGERGILCLKPIDTYQLEGTTTTRRDMQAQENTLISKFSIGNYCRKQ